MAKKIKTPIYDIVKPIVSGLVLASKLATGPYGFIVRTAFPKFMDHVIRPLFVRARIFFNRKKNETEGENHANDLDQANTPDDYLSTLNNRK